MSSHVSNADMEDDQRRSTTVSLKPFIHQVGGHCSIQLIDQYTVCKPLFSKELRFYQNVCPLFKPFIPEFKGVVSLKKVEENGDGSTWKMVSSGNNIKHHSYRYGKHCSSCACLQKDRKDSNQGYEKAVKTILADPVQDWNDSAMNSCHDHYFDDTSLECILLENVVSQYKRPSILDLKMGTEKHKDNVFSKEEAIRRQVRWDQTTSRSLGVRVCGMKVYLVTEENFLVKTQAHGRELTVEGFKDTIKAFLFNGKKSRYDVVEPYLKQLRELLDIMEHQTSYRFYNTSLLLIYEGDVSENDHATIYSTSNGEDLQTNTPEQRKSSLTNVGVRMIDFAHVQNNNQNMNSELRQVLDECYLFGLRSVIRILEEISAGLQSNNPPLEK